MHFRAFKFQLNNQFRYLYRRIITQLDKYFQVYADKRLGKKLVAAEQLFNELPIESSDNKVLTKKKALVKIMECVHANSVSTDIKELHLSEFGRLQYKPRVKLPVNTLLVSESPTGLFSTTKDLA
ncbi:Cas9 endonuclease PAM-interacting domain-containing protein [Schleiferilactobacillus harbinensis]|uniref:Cas9 endonuclease PAM-interacting domain-containing protein n=1 Tax=Schleiferilactobacillus harbinensis TaxID=304207 RepID=UPI00168B4C19